MAEASAAGSSRLEDDRVCRAQISRAWRTHAVDIRFIEARGAPCGGWLALGFASRGNDWFDHRTHCARSARVSLGSESGGCDDWDAPIEGSQPGPSGAIARYAEVIYDYGTRV